MHPSDILLTERDLAGRWQISAKTLRNGRVLGLARLPFLKIGRAVRYRLADIELYEANQLRMSTSDHAAASPNKAVSKS